MRVAFSSRRTPLHGMRGFGAVGSLVFPALASPKIQHERGSDMYQRCGKNSWKSGVRLVPRAQPLGSVRVSFQSRPECAVQRRVRGAFLDPRKTRSEVRGKCCGMNGSCGRGTKKDKIETCADHTPNTRTEQSLRAVFCWCVETDGDRCSFSPR